MAFDSGLTFQEAGSYGSEILGGEGSILLGSKHFGRSAFPHTFFSSLFHEMITSILKGNKFDYSKVLLLLILLPVWFPILLLYSGS